MAALPFGPLLRSRTWPVLCAPTSDRCRAVGWYLRNDSPDEALEYSIAAGDVDK